MTHETQILEKLPVQYKTLISELDDADKKILVKHLPNYNAYREFANLVELGIDVAARRKELDADPTKKLHGAKVVSTFSTILGVPESTIAHVARSVDIFGGTYLRDLVLEATAKGVKLTYSHIRELNRLDSADWATERQNIINKILSGDIVTHREVIAAVDELLGVNRKSTTQYIEGDDDATEEEKAFAKADKKVAAEGDALDNIATDSDIEKLCAQLVDAINAADKKLGKIGEKIRTWREDVAFETLESMCMDCLDSASISANDFAAKVKDIGMALDDVIRTVVASQSGV